MTIASSNESPLRYASGAAALGLGTGAVEVAANFVLHQVEGGSRGGPLSALWMGPLVEAVIFSLLGYALGLVARWVAPERRFRAVAFVMLWVAFIAVLWQVWQLYTYAAVILAAGLAARGAVMVSRRGATLLRLAPRALAAGLLAIGALAVGLRLFDAQREQSELAALPPAPAGAPNVLLVTLDTVRAEHLSLYGYRRPTTPNLERLAAAGTVFDAAFATSSWTLPSHASLFTGRYPGEMSYGWTKRLSTSSPLIAEEFRRRGYETAAFVGNVQYASNEAGLGAGLVHSESYPTDLGQAVLSSAIGRAVSELGPVRRAVDYHDPLNRRRASALNERLLQWLGARKGGRPFYAFVNYYDAHDPLLPPPPFDTLFGPSRPSGTFSYGADDVDPTDRRSWDAEDVQRHVNAYDASIAYLDEHVGRLMDALKAQGLLEQTLVVVTADHGELLGENGLFGHGQSLHTGTLHVPLLMMYPRRLPAGTRVQASVSLRDVAATIIDVAGFSHDSRLSGVSLAPFWRAPGGAPEPTRSPILSQLQAAPFMPSHYPASKADMTSLYVGSRHYIRHANGREEIYDWLADPEERTNLAGIEPFPPTAAFSAPSAPRN